MRFGATPSWRRDVATVEVFRLDDEHHYVLDATAGGDETLTLATFDDLAIDLNDVWFDEPDTD